MNTSAIDKTRKDWRHKYIWDSSLGTDHRRKSFNYMGFTLAETRGFEELNWDTLPYGMREHILKFVGELEFDV